MIDAARHVTERILASRTNGAGSAAQLAVPSAMPSAMPVEARVSSRAPCGCSCGIESCAGGGDLLLDVHLVERGAQTLGQLVRIVVGQKCMKNSAAVR